MLQICHPYLCFAGVLLDHILIRDILQNTQSPARRQGQTFPEKSSTLSGACCHERQATCAHQSHTLCTDRHPRKKIWARSSSLSTLQTIHVWPGQRRSPIQPTGILPSASLTITRPTIYHFSANSLLSRLDLFGTLLAKCLLFSTPAPRCALAQYLSPARMALPPYLTFDEVPPPSMH